MNAALQKDILTEAYAEMGNLIHDTAWRFKERYGGDIEELKSDANLLFVQAINSYDETRALMSTWVRFKIWKGLLNIQIRGHKKQAFTFVGDVEFTNQHYTPKSSFAYITELYEQVGADTRFLIQITLCPPEGITQEDLEKGFGKRVSRKVIKQNLRSIGWSWKRIKETFRELQSII